MPGVPSADRLRQLAGSLSTAADRDLLARFVAERDGASFAELVRRHGPVVLAACRRGTRNHHDGDDAFQAVFLTLARRAGGIQRPELLGNWLYRVAVRVAWRARRGAARRREREVQGVGVPEPVAPSPAAPNELGSVLDEELGALPAWYRDALFQCDLRGLSRADAAAALGIPLGTLASRLDAGRKKLAARLVRRGVTLSVGAVLVGARAVAVPGPLLNKACEVVAVWSAGGAPPRPVLQLAQGGLPVRRTMFLGLVAASALTVVGFGHAARTPVQSPPAPPPAAADKKAEPGPGATPGFAFASRPRKAVDLPVKEVRQAAWSPDGGWLVVVGPESVEKPDRKGLHAAFAQPVFAAQDGSVTLELPRSGTLAGVVTTKSGPVVVTDLREFRLVSGLHQLGLWSLADPTPPGAGGSRFPSRQYRPGQTVDLDPVATHGYALAADSKSYRTVHVPNRDKGGLVEVREVTLAPGQSETRRLLGVAGRRGDLTAGGRVLLVTEDAAVTAYEVSGGMKLWARAFAPGQRVEHVGASADGAVLVVIHSDFRVSTLDGRTGRVLPRLEGIEEVVVPGCGPQNFSAGGHLVALGVNPLKNLAQGRPGGTAINVWNAGTGKLVQSWGGAATVAFHPSKPMLALLEPNGEQTRFGLWDFAEQP